MQTRDKGMVRELEHGKDDGAKTFTAVVEEEEGHRWDENIHHG